MISPALNTCRFTSSRLVSSARTSAFLLARSTLPSSVARLLHTAGKLPVCFDDLWMHNSS